MRRLAQLALFIGIIALANPAFGQFDDEFDRTDLMDEHEDGFDGSVPLTDDSDEPFLDTFTSYLCEECRDPYQYPMDFVAFYHNGSQFHGEGPYRDQQYYLVKIYYGDGTNFVLVWTVTLDNEGSVLFPTQIATFFVRLPNGQIIQQQTLVNQPNLPIGESIPEQNDGYEEDSGDEGDDDFSEDEEENWDDDDDWGDDDWGDDDEGDDGIVLIEDDEDDEGGGDGNCDACEAFFDGDEDGDLEGPYEFTDDEDVLEEL